MSSVSSTPTPIPPTLTASGAAPRVRVMIPGAGLALTCELIGETETAWLLRDVLGEWSLDRTAGNVVPADDEIEADAIVVTRLRRAGRNAMARSRRAEKALSGGTPDRTVIAAFEVKKIGGRWIEVEVTKGTGSTRKPVEKTRNGRIRKFVGIDSAGRTWHVKECYVMKPTDTITAEGVLVRGDGIVKKMQYLDRPVIAPTAEGTWNVVRHPATGSEPTAEA